MGRVKIAVIYNICIYKDSTLTFNEVKFITGIATDTSGQAFYRYLNQMYLQLILQIHKYNYFKWTDLVLNCLLYFPSFFIHMCKQAELCDRFSLVSVV